ncbi:phosphopantetheine-binding protein [Streptomyces sp. NPDC005438]|uniref:phosphopantetheine-binding protein n=1 Tax=Streptomyces sp. NPDC005438 TaxID=3156880 RepID=UPI0033A3BA22
MTEQPWTALFEETLRAHVPLLPPDQPITADLALADHGLDSLATVSLLLDLEEAFLVTIPDHLLTESTFATPDGLWSVIDSLLVKDPVE